MNPYMAGAYDNLAGLPISQVMVQGLEEATREDDMLDAAAALAASCAAIVSLERLIRDAGRVLAE